MENLNAGMVARLYVPRPTLAEQYRIVARVETAMQSCAVAVSKVQRDIDLLREYRTRLVADVVTGKLDVRDAAIRLPAEVDETEEVIALEEEDEREELLEAFADDA
jgi:type I restriction enzyme S subunit